MITGFHTIIYSTDSPATRAFFRDVLSWPSVDGGAGWLIFRTPPSEMGVHPTSDDVPNHQVSLMCDDITTTIADLRSKGVQVDDDVHEQRAGLVTWIEVPGAGRITLYQPRHPVAYDLGGS